MTTDALPIRPQPLSYYQTALRCGSRICDRDRGLNLARDYHAARQAWLSAILAEPCRKLVAAEEAPRLAAHARIVAALDGLRVLGGIPLVDFVVFAAQHAECVQAAIDDGSVRDMHLSRVILAGQLAALSHRTFGAVYWRKP